MSLILPNGVAPDGEKKIVQDGGMVDIGQVMAQVAADVCAKILNEGFQPSFDEAIEPYKKRIEELEGKIERLEERLNNMENK